MAIGMKATSPRRVLGKRVFDVGVLLLTCWLWLPLLLAVAILVRIKLGSPVFFIQPRGGLRGRTFPLLKFRSMLETRDAQGQLLPDAQRLTTFSRRLRSTSLDELPCLLNVLKGDMSLVGPRPFLAEYLPLYSAQQAQRHDVQPGVTGWAQVNGRNDLSWERKFELDLWYVANRTFWLDMRILWLTVLRVVTRSGVAQEGHATTERFRGSAR
jgi:sugar transferase EpsL